MTRGRVAVTGLGVVSALGRDAGAFAEGLREGRCGIAPSRRIDLSAFRSRFVAEAEEPELPEFADLPAWTSLPDRFGLRAALDAVRDAGLRHDQLSGAGVYFGTGTGGMQHTEDYAAERLAGRRPAAATLVSHQPSAVTDLLCRLLSIRGPRGTIMTACSSSALALGLAMDLIRLGEVEVALAGGAEGLCRLTCAGFGALRATAPVPCQPFDVARKGLSLGEGAAVLVLESEEHAARRGGRVICYLAGYGATADAHHMTAPHPEGEGAARAMRIALADAEIGPESVGYINAHGTATPHNDSAEAAAIRAVFGARASEIPVSSIKSMVGHTLGAAGAMEAAACAISLRDGFLPTTINHKEQDPAFGLNVIQGPALVRSVDTVLSNSFAFGGNNVALVLRRAS